MPLETVSTQNHTRQAVLHRLEGTCSEDAEGTNRSVIVAGERDEDDEIDVHEEDQGRFEEEEGRVFVFESEALEGAAVEIDDCVEDEEGQKRCFY